MINPMNLIPLKKKWGNLSKIRFPTLLTQCGRWDLNPHVYTDTRSLVLPVCQFQHSRIYVPQVVYYHLSLRKSIPHLKKIDVFFEIRQVGSNTKSVPVHQCICRRTVCLKLYFVSSLIQILQNRRLAFVNPQHPKLPARFLIFRGNVKQKLHRMIQFFQRLSGMGKGNIIHADISVLTPDTVKRLAALPALHDLIGCDADRVNFITGRKCSCAVK